MNKLIFVALGLAFALACGSSTDPQSSCDGVSCGPNGSCVSGACQCTAGFTGASCDTCAPQCTRKQCGPDGCGGTCGTCPANGACTNGLCPCVPQCTGKTCGPDGCGGQCGACAGVCSASGQCCTPNCAGKTCGMDGCGGFCGRCTGDQVCIRDNCGVDNGLACVRVTDTCDSDGDCGGAPNRCRQAPVMKCIMPPDDCGSTTTICRSVLQCWRTCNADAECPPESGKTHCVDNLCQACGVDAHCVGGVPCVNNNARDRCASGADCNGVATNSCR